MFYIGLSIFLPGNVISIVKGNKMDKSILFCIENY